MQDNIYTYLTKSLDFQTGFLYDRKEAVKAPLWSTGKSELHSIYTSSNQPHHQKIYYRDIYSNDLRTGSYDVEFSIAYGHYAGSGSSTGSYGLINTFVTESRAIYNQYRNYLLDQDKLKYVENGKFRFFGYNNVLLGSYFWGTEYWIPSLAAWSYPTRISLPNVTSNILNNAKSISIGKSSPYTPNGSVIAIVSNDGRLFLTYPFLRRDNPTAQITNQIGKDYDWESVSFGHGHLLAIKDDGSLWVSGYNANGQLGLGYYSTEDEDIPLQRLGTDTWIYVEAGADYSFGIKSDGTLWSWGNNFQGQLGVGDTTNRNIPTQVGSATWKMVSAANSFDYAEYTQTVIGIQTDGTLWGWGDNNSGVISIGNPDTTIPYQLGVATDWEKISVGKAFAVGIKTDGSIWSWGANDQNGTLGINSSSPASFPFNLGLQQPSADTDWIDVSCGPDFVIAIKGDNRLYGWGNDNQYQLGSGPRIPGQMYIKALFPLELNNKLGWTKVETAPYMSIGVIGDADLNSLTYIDSDDIVALSLSRWNFRDRVEAGTWELPLSAVDSDLNVDTNNTITLIDSGIDYLGTDFESPSYKYNLTGDVVYGVYSGSLSDGIHPDAKTKPYGLFFPDNGIIILSGESLSSASIDLRRTPATSSGAFPFSSNADMVYTSISGAMSVDNSFIGNTVEIMNPMYCFIRINNYEFNITNNPSYYTLNNNVYNNRVVKEHLRNSNTEFVYITTIGLYNDSGDLLAVAKLSKPIKKTNMDELIIKVKIDI
jgi:hypothetical protein